MAAGASSSWGCVQARPVLPAARGVAWDACDLPRMAWHGMAFALAYFGGMLLAWHPQ